MTAEAETQNEYDDGLTGPGAPTPLSALEVRSESVGGDQLPQMISWLSIFPSTHSRV